MGSDNGHEHNRIAILHDNGSGCLLGDFVGLDGEGSAPDFFFD